MIYNPEKSQIILERKLNSLDLFVIDFCDILGDYVIVSGYVSILFGRSRATEDVDLLIPKMGFPEFKALWDKIFSAGFECLNTSNSEEAYESLNDYAIRFARKGKPIPNIEFKLIKNDVEEYSFENKLKVVLSEKLLFVSPLEMQIAYKLFLGSEKDLEDAKHIYELFKEKINNAELISLCRKLKVENKFGMIK